MNLKRFDLWRDPQSDGGVIDASEARFRAWLLAAAMLLGPPLLLYLYYQRMFAGLIDPNAMDFAQLGRNLSAGKGFTTYFLRPLVIVPGRDLLHQPELTHGPLYPIVLALAFGLLGASDAVVAGVSSLFFLLTIPVLYILGMRVFGRTVGLITAAIFTCSAAMLNAAISGTHITLYVFLMTSLLLVIYDLASEFAVPGARLPRGKLVLAGVLTGLLYLTDPILLFVVPVVAVAVIWLNPQRRSQTALWLLVPLCFLMLLYMQYNYRLGGNPFFGPRGLELWMDTRTYSNEAGYRLSRGDFVPGQAIFKAVISKVFIKFGNQLQSFSHLPASWMLIFFVPGLFFRFTDRPSNILRRVMLWCFLACLVGTLLFSIALPLYLSVVPVMLAFAVAYLLHILRQAQLSRSEMRLAVGLLAAVMLYPLFGDMALAERPEAQPEIRSARILAKQTNRADVVLTDDPMLVAWYANRASLWLPARNERVARIRSRNPQVRWLFLTSQLQRVSSDWNWPDWQRVYIQFYQMNQAFRQAKAAGQTPPDSFTLTPTSASPLSEALDGFTWIAPEKADPNTVMAATAPPTSDLSLQSEPHSAADARP